MPAVRAAAPRTYDKVHWANCANEFPPRRKSIPTSTEIEAHFEPTGESSKRRKSKTIGISQRLRHPPQPRKLVTKFTGRIAQTNFHLDGNRSRPRPKSKRILSKRGKRQNDKVENYWDFPKAAAFAAAPKTYDKVRGAN